jgi:hypothetical protein
MEKNPRFQGFCCTSALNTFICNQLQITGTFLKNLKLHNTKNHLSDPGDHRLCLELTGYSNTHLGQHFVFRHDDD